MTARGEVVQQVATAYLHAIAASSEVDNATGAGGAGPGCCSIMRMHAHEAGVAANLDELRARVQLQAQQQALIYAQNALEKDLILLKREIGIDPGQKIALTDAAPYSDLAEQTPEEVRAMAYKNRQDYQNLQNQMVVYKALHTISKTQRLPTLDVQQLLRHGHGEWGGDAWKLCRDGDVDRTAVSRGELARAMKMHRLRS